MILTGCGYDVQLNGAVFDMMGVSGSSSGSKKEPQMANRAGLVLPPSTDRLPVPGAEPQKAAQSDASWPVDPEQRKVDVAMAERRAHEEYCKKALLDAKAQGNSAHEAVIGPQGRCDGSALNLFSLTNPTTGSTR